MKIMSVSAEKLEEVSNLAIQYFVDGAWESWVELFDENGSFINPLFSNPIVGRENILNLVKGWDVPELRIKWKIMEGYRIVTGWEQEIGSAKWMSGVSVIVLGADGLIENYEGIFNAELVRN